MTKYFFHVKIPPKYILANVIYDVTSKSIVSGGFFQNGGVHSVLCFCSVYYKFLRQMLQSLGARITTV